jgi:hypothetical protein
VPDKYYIYLARPLVPYIHKKLLSFAGFGGAKEGGKKPEV